MNDSVVLGGDHSVLIETDGDLEMLFNIGAGVSLDNVIDGSTELAHEISGELSLIHVLSGVCGIVTEIRGGAYPEYSGQTEVIPSNQMQRLETANKSVLSDINIMPIPSNYGLITWNGSTLTVS